MGCWWYVYLLMGRLLDGAQRVDIKGVLSVGGGGLVYRYHMSCCWAVCNVAKRLLDGV